MNLTRASQDTATDLTTPDYHLLSDEAKNLIRDTWSDNTKRTYRSQWNGYAKWSSDNGMPPLPCANTTLTNYVAHLANLGRKPASIQTAIHAIKAVAKVAGQRVDTELAVQAASAHKRRVGSRQKQAPPLVAELVRQVVETMGTTNRFDLRDRVVFLVGFTGMFRRSELSDIRIEDLNQVSQGLEIFLRRSKTDQSGEGAIRIIPWGAHENTCPVKAALAWMEELAKAGVYDGPLLRGIHRSGSLLRSGLTPGAINNTIKKRAKEAGLDDASAHSLRAGGATELAQQDVATAFIAEQGGWNPTAPTVHRYVRSAGRWKNNPMARSGL